MPGRNEVTSNAALVREQLRRLVAHPLFTNSKRYPVLLAYTVEQTLLGNSGDLKERTIGVEAFGREPSYDVNLDPVVRMTAAEVRKRLVQYYYSPGHTGELIIELPVGSYIPLFRESSPHTAIQIDSQLAYEAHEVSPQGSVEAADRLADSAKGSRGGPVNAWIPIAIALLVAGLLGFGAAHVRFPGQAARSSGLSNMDRFWEPITATSGRVTYCLGVPTESVDLQSKTIPATPAGESGSLNVYDVITLARSITPLVPKNSEFRVLAGPETGFAQLREGPFVLIGAFDNPWTMRITQDLPIGFEYDSSHVHEVVNRKSVCGKIWTLQWQVPAKVLQGTTPSLPAFMIRSPESLSSYLPAFQGKEPKPQPRSSPIRRI
jgi:hypothetical protein